MVKEVCCFRMFNVELKEEKTSVAMRTNQRVKMQPKRRSGPVLARNHLILYTILALLLIQLIFAQFNCESLKSSSQSASHQQFNLLRRRAHSAPTIGANNNNNNNNKRLLGPEETIVSQQAESPPIEQPEARFAFGSQQEKLNEEQVEKREAKVQQQQRQKSRVTRQVVNQAPAKLELKTKQDEHDDWEKIVQKLLLEYPSRRNVELVEELRRRQLDFRIFYPKIKQQPGARKTRTTDDNSTETHTVSEEEDEEPEVERDERQTDGQTSISRRHLGAPTNWRSLQESSSANLKRNGNVVIGSSKAKLESAVNQVSVHYNNGSFFLKAFNYKFRLKLELNTNLFGPNLIQKHILKNNYQKISTNQRIEHCYYHGRTTVDSHPQAIGAFRTCKGLSGIIHVNNENFVILPFYDASGSKKPPHIIYRYSKSNNNNSHKLSSVDHQNLGPKLDGQQHRRECGNSRLHEWALRQYDKPANISSSSSSLQQQRAEASYYSDSLASAQISLRLERHLSSESENEKAEATGSAAKNESILEGREKCLSERDGNSCDKLGAKSTRANLSTAAPRDSSLGATSDDNHTRREGGRGRGGALEFKSKSKITTRSARLSKRDRGLTEKHIELALVLSQDMFDKRESLSFEEVLHDAIQIVNCLDLYFRSANTRVALIYLETWAHGDQIELMGDVKQTLYNFLEYSTRKLYKVSMDAAHLLTGGHLRQFNDHEVGMSFPDSICSARAVSVSQESSRFEPFIAASTMAHMLGHNLGMEHDEPLLNGLSGRDEEPLVEPSSASLVGGPQLVQTAPGALKSEQLPVGVTEVGRPHLSSGASKMATSAPPKYRPSQVDHLAEDGEDDGMKSRSISGSDLEPPDDMGHSIRNNDSEIGTSGSAYCELDCLMSERFLYVESPIVFSNVPIGSAQQLNDSFPDENQLNLESFTSYQNHAQTSNLPFRFSRQSIETYHRRLREGHGICLFNKPYQLEEFKNCGNGIVEKGEDCDCGTFQECHRANDSCCDPVTCRFKADAECINGACCDRCKLRPAGFVCRKSRGECDLTELCDGKKGHCAPDVYKQNGSPCALGAGYCYLGQCPQHDQQCQELWGQDGKKSDRLCYSNFNLNGTIRGNCGYNSTLRKYKRCLDQEHMMCGTLQCQLGDLKPVMASNSELLLEDPAGSANSAAAGSVSSTVPPHSIKIIHAPGGLGGPYECKAITGSDSYSANQATSSTSQQAPPVISYVRDGSKCAPNKVCFNQTCQSIEQVYRESLELCPKDEKNRPCSGNGVCSTANRCHCEPDWTGHDCSQRNNRFLITTSGLLTQNFVSNQPAQQVEVSGAVGQVSPVSLLPVGTDIPVSSVRPETIATTLAPDVTTVAAGKPIPAPAPSNGTSSSSSAPAQDKKKHDALGAPILVFILVSIVAAVYVGFALMANCYRRKGFYKPDKVLRHHQMNCKLDALRSSFIAKRLADSELAVSNFDLSIGPQQQPQLAQALQSIPALDGLGDMLSPFVSPSSGQAPVSGPCPYAFNGPSELVQLTNSDLMMQPPATGNSALIFGSGQPTLASAAPQQTTFYQPQSHQHHHQKVAAKLHQPHQISASIHYFDEKQQGDRIPNVMAADLSSNQRPMNQPMMRTFHGNYEPQWMSHRGSNQPPEALRHRTGQSHRAYQINRATSLGNVNRQLQQQQQQLHQQSLHHRHRHHHHQYLLHHQRPNDLEMSDDDDDTQRTHRALATPLRTARGSHRRSRNRIFDDSCSAPSSPEHKDTYWVDGAGSGRHHRPHNANTLKRQHSGQAPNLIGSGGYHEEAILDALNMNETLGLLSGPSTNRRSLANVIDSANLRPDLSRQQSSEQQQQQKNKQQQQHEMTGDADDDEEDDEQLPPLPPPPSGHMLDATTEDESEPSSVLDQQQQQQHQRGLRNNPSRTGDLSTFKATSQVSSTRTLKRVPLNNGPEQRSQSTSHHHQQASAHSYVDHNQLSLISQLQQLEQVQNQYQKQVQAGDKTKTSSISGSDSLHEFFSLPLSVQLSALLARSVGDSRDFSMSTIDDMLNNLNNSSVANLSRRNFTKGQQSGSSQQLAQASSRGGTLKRNQVKLQNLQGLISRLQKLHNQTALQQQLDELNGELDEEQFVATATGSRHSTLGRTHRAHSYQSRSNQTADDLFGVGQNSAENRSKKSQVKRILQKRENTGAKMNESIYSMSDSEDGLFAPRSYIHRQTEIETKETETDIKKQLEETSANNNSNEVAKNNNPPDKQLDQQILDHKTVGDSSESPSSSQAASIASNKKQ